MKFPYYKPMGYPGGIYRVGPLVRLPPGRHAEFQEMQNTRELSPEGKMQGYFWIEPNGYATRAQWNMWFTEALAYNPQAKATPPRKRAAAGPQPPPTQQTPPTRSIVTVTSSGVVMKGTSSVARAAVAARVARVARVARARAARQRVFWQNVRVFCRLLPQAVWRRVDVYQ